MNKENNYQFIIDSIPDKDLEEFLNIKWDFMKKTSCRFQYKEGKGVKHPLLPIPTQHTSHLHHHSNEKTNKKAEEKSRKEITIKSKEIKN